MNNKIYGNFLIGKTMSGVFAYLVVASLGVFAMKFVYTLISGLIGFSFILIDIGIWILIVIMLFIIATRIILLFKIENVKIFSILTMLASLWLVYVYYYAIVAANLSIYGYFISPFDFKTVFEIVSNFFSEEISISRRATNEIVIPGFFNYIFTLVVIASFLIPKGTFSFAKGIYIDGQKIEFEKYHLYSKSKIDVNTLKSENNILLLDESDLLSNSFMKGEYYTLYVSKDYNNRVYQLIKNVVQESKKHKQTIRIQDAAKFYYSLKFNINTVVNDFKPYKAEYEIIDIDNK